MEENIINKITIKNIAYSIQDERVENLSNKITENSGSISSLSENQDTLSSNMETLTNDLADIVQNVEVEREHINSINKEFSRSIANTESKIETIENNFENIQTEINSCSQTIDSKQNSLVAGENIRIENDTISSKDTTYGPATESSNGLMSKEDKLKLKDLEPANNGKLTLNVYGVDNIFTANQSDDSVINIPSEIDDTIDSNNNTWSAAKIKSLITNINLLKLEIVNELPIDNIKTDTIYLVPTETEDVKNEYIYIDGEWFLIGNTKIDLTNYYTKDETCSEYQINGKLNTIKNEILNNIKNGKLILKLDNTIIGTFTANQSDDKVVQIPNIASDWYDIDEEYGSGNILTNPNDVLYDSDLSLESENAVQNKVITEELNKKPNNNELSRVAFTGKYEDLLDKPTITDGKSAYDIWLDLGNEGTEQDFINSLKGKDGDDASVEQYTAGKDIDITKNVISLSSNFVKQVADLDGYSEAQDGEIIQYVGQTSENYTHGFFYERKAGKRKGILKIKEEWAAYVSIIWLTGEPAFTDLSTETVGTYKNVMTFTDATGNYIGRASIWLQDDGTILLPPAIEDANGNFNYSNDWNDKIDWALEDQPASWQQTDVQPQPILPQQSKFYVIEASIITNNLSEIASGLATNDVVLINNIGDKVINFTLNNETVQLKGDNSFDIPLRYIGNNEFKPIQFPLL